MPESSSSVSAQLAHSPSTYLQSTLCACIHSINVVLGIMKKSVQNVLLSTDLSWKWRKGWSRLLQVKISFFKKLRTQKMGFRWLLSILGRGWLAKLQLGLADTLSWGRAPVGFWVLYFITTFSVVLFSPYTSFLICYVTCLESPRPELHHTCEETLVLCVYLDWTIEWSSSVACLVVVSSVVNYLFSFFVSSLIEILVVYIIWLLRF